MTKTKAKREPTYLLDCVLPSTDVTADGFLAKHNGKKASEKVERAMHERKRGTLKSGRSGKKVTSKKQAIAIGLSEARKSGAKVPGKKSSSKKK
jgi:Family of unknown function (DUF6496)